LHREKTKKKAKKPRGEDTEEFEDTERRQKSERGKREKEKELGEGSVLGLEFPSLSLLCVLVWSLCPRSVSCFFSLSFLCAISVLSVTLWLISSAPVSLISAA
jgi:hypothetical protein